MITVDGKTRICGLIGNPVEHTLSPLIHNTLAQKEGRNMVYVPFLVEHSQIEASIKGAFGLNILGMNVTVPYKSKVISYLKDIDSLAEKIGAVNTLVRAKDGYKGYNTDMLGLLRALQAEYIQLKGEEVILLGAGGASRAVAFLCAQYDVRRVYLLNRTLDKARAIAEEINKSFCKEIIIPMELADYMMLPDKQFLCIQGTSVGLYPRTEEAVITEPSFYKKIHTGYDLIYKPSATKFMRLVKEAGGRSYNGLKMLLYQGIIAYELWNDTDISEETADYVYGILQQAMQKEEQ